MFVVRTSFDALISVRVVLSMRSIATHKLHRPFVTGRTASWGLLVGRCKCFRLWYVYMIPAHLPHTFCGHAHDFLLLEENFLVPPSDKNKLKKEEEGRRKKPIATWCNKFRAPLHSGGETCAAKMQGALEAAVHGPNVSVLMTSVYCDVILNGKLPSWPSDAQIDISLIDACR